MAVCWNCVGCPRAYMTPHSAYIASLVRSRCEGHPGAKNKLPYCSAEVASHQTVEDWVDGGISVAEK
jgi:hypothetical protein